MWLSFASLDTLLLPLQVGHFGLLQHYYGIGVDDCFRNHEENIGFAPQHFQFILKRVGKPTAWLILSVPFALRHCNPQPSHPHQTSSKEAQGEIESVLLEKTPYTKRQLRQQTNASLAFVKTAIPGKVHGGNSQSSSPRIHLTMASLAAADSSCSFSCALHRV